MPLSEICARFQADTERLNERDEDYAARLKSLVLNLAKDAAEHVEHYAMGEIPALLQRCHDVLASLKSESEDPEDRKRRYDRRQAELNLLTLCEGIRRFHTGKRKAADLAALSDLVADALGPLVERVENAEPAPNRETSFKCKGALICRYP